MLESRGLVDGKREKMTNEFHTNEGVIKDGKFFAKGKNEGEPLEDVEFSVHPGGPFGNFIDCVRSRKRENLNADILVGHRSTLLCHLGNISYQLGSQVPFRKKTDVLGSDADVGEAFESMKRHLTAAAKLNLDTATYRLGRKLAFDAAAERFVGDDEANRRLVGPHRDGYVAADIDATGSVFPSAAQIPA